MTTLTLFLWDQCLGSLPSGRGRGHTAYACLKCGQIWGRVVSDHPHATWHFCHRACPKCGPALGWPWNADSGSLLDAEHWDGTPLQASNPVLPEPLLHWEFSLALGKFPA